MEYLTCVSIPTPDVEFYGRPVGDMVRKGARIQSDGIVKGRFPYINGYISINGKTSGHYFPAWINVPGHKCEIVRCSDGSSVEGTLDAGPDDNYIVILMDDNKEFDIKVDGKLICHLDFSEAILEEKREDKGMNVNFFDEGICGVAISGHIGSLNKDSAENSVVVKKAMPTGVKLINIIAVASSDMKGATKVSVGDGANSTSYVSDIEVNAGGTVVKDTALKDVTSGTVTIKADQAITAGSIDVFATIVRLSV